MKKIFLFVLSFIMVISSFSIVGFTGKNDVVTADAATAISEVDVYFIAGQSNASGYTYFSRNILDPKTNEGCLNVSTNISDDRIDAYKAGFDNVLYMGRADSNYFNELTPVKPGMGISTSQFGAELGLAEVLDPIYDGTNKKAVIIKYALGGSSIIGIAGNSAGNWCAPSYKEKHNVTIEGADLYAGMVGTSNNEYSDGFIWKALMEMYNSGYKTVNLKGLLWAQGEAECNNKMYTKHQEGFECFIKDFRENLTTISELAMTKKANFNISDASELDCLISEVCPSFANSQELSDHTSSNAYINSVINQQRAIAKNDENVVTMTTHEYLIREDKAGMASLDRSKSYCNDYYHYNADDMIDIGNRAAEIMYYFSAGENLEVEQATGLWVKIDGKVTRRTINTDGRETFKLLVGGNATVTIDKTNKTVTIDPAKGYKVKEIGYYINGLTNLQKNDAFVLDNNTVILPDGFMNLVNKNQVVFFAVNLEKIETRDLTLITLSHLIVEGIENGKTYMVGETLSFKVYYDSADAVGVYALDEVSLNNVRLTADANGYFSFVVSDSKNLSVRVKAAPIATANPIYADYILELHPSVTVPEQEPETPAEPENPTEPETPNDNGSSGGLNCQMGIGSTSILFAVIACLGAVVIATKRIIKSK